MQDISKLRFDPLAAYCRHPAASLFAQEVRWLHAADEQVLVTLVVDTDGEFSGILLARDLKERYRSVAVTDFFESADEALAGTRQKVEEILPKLDEERIQGDDYGPAVDFSGHGGLRTCFTPTLPGWRLRKRSRPLAASSSP